MPNTCPKTPYKKDNTVYTEKTKPYTKKTSPYSEKTYCTGYLQQSNSGYLLTSAGFKIKI